MHGAYFINPDALEPIPASRTYEELRQHALGLRPTGILVVTSDEFDLIKRETSLAYTWQGRRIFAPPCACNKHA